MIRLLLAAPVFLVATLLFFGSLYEYSSIGSESRIESIQKTINKNKGIDKILRATASYVDDFYKLNQRYPTDSEREVWVSEQPKTIYRLRLFSNERDYPSEVLARFGEPSDNSYILALWRGDWHEYYVSWKNETTLSFDAKDYEASFGGFVFMLALSFLMYLLSALLGSRRLQKRLNHSVAKLANRFLSPKAYSSIATFIRRRKQYLKIILVWFSAGVILGLLLAAGGGVGPGSYIIWFGTVGLFLLLSGIHCVVIFGRVLLNSRADKIPP